MLSHSTELPDTPLSSSQEESKKKKSPGQAAIVDADVFTATCLTDYILDDLPVIHFTEITPFIYYSAKNKVAHLFIEICNDSDTVIDIVTQLRLLKAVQPDMTITVITRITDGNVLWSFCSLPGVSIISKRESLRNLFIACQLCRYDVYYSPYIKTCLSGRERIPLDNRDWLLIKKLAANISTSPQFPELHSTWTETANSRKRIMNKLGMTRRTELGRYIVLLATNAFIP